MTGNATTKVVIVAGTVPQQQGALAAKLGQLRAAGAEITLACNFDPALLPADVAVTRVALLAHSGPQAARLQRALGVASAAQKVWLHVRRNAQLRRAARDADVLVALDQLAIYAVWELAQRHRRPAAVYGADPALQAVRQHRQDPDRAARGLLPSVPALGGAAYRDVRQAAVTSAASMARATLSPAVMRTSAGAGFWSAVVALPRVPDGVRRRMVNTVHNNLLKAGRADAARVTEGARRRIRDRHVLADLLLRQAQAELAYGVPASLGAAVKANLELADNHLRRKEAAKAAQAAHRVYQLLFHRSLHTDPATSPLVTDPAGFLAGWRAGPTVQRLTAPRARTAPAALTTGRLLIVADRGDAAVRSRADDLRRRYETTPGVEVRLVDLAEQEELAGFRPPDKQIVEHLVTGASVYGNKLETLLRPHLDWADTVLVDGCGAAAAAVGLLNPGTARVVVRLDGAQIRSGWPHVMDFTRVDDLVFDTAEDEAGALASLPALSADGAPRRHQALQLDAAVLGRTP